MKKGIVRFFNLASKFGFIIDIEDQKEYYVHIKDVKKPIKAGDRVVFEVASSKKGLRAVKVDIESET